MTTFSSGDILLQDHPIARFDWIIGDVGQPGTPRDMNLLHIVAVHGEVWLCPDTAEKLREFLNSFTKPAEPEEEEDDD